MATQTIAWGDGTADKMTVTYSGTIGSSQMAVASDPNASLSQRVKTINLKDSSGVIRATLTVTQNPRSRDFSTAYNNAYK